MRVCPYCNRSFLPKARAPHQLVCSSPPCQAKRKADYHRHKLQRDPDYKQTCLNSCSKWRSSHPGYMTGYRACHPQQVERNRLKQRLRDSSTTIPPDPVINNLVNNNPVAGSIPNALDVYLLAPGTPDLVNNNPVAGSYSLLSSIYILAPAGTRLVKNISVPG